MTIRPTLDQHFSYGYGSGSFNPQDKAADNFWCSYSRCTREPLDFKSECEAVARLIGAEAKRLGRRIIVMLSGGMDSEVVAKSFIAAGVEFEAITYRFENQLNAHEIQFVTRFVQRHHLKHSFYDLNILDWITSAEAAKLYSESQACTCGLIPHMKLMNHIWFELNGLPVLGNGDVYLEKFDGVWKYAELEYMLAWFRHAVKNQILGAIGFFQFTPEVTLAMLREPKIERLGLNQDAYATRAYETSRFIKYSVYRKHWPDLEIRPKFGGDEFVLRQFAAASKKHFGDREVTYSDKFVIEYSDFRDCLEPSGSTTRPGYFKAWKKS